MRSATLVPVPPSIVEGEQGYDNRMFQICKNIPVNFSIDVKELIKQKISTPPVHKSTDHRPSVEEIIQNYRIDDSGVVDTPKHIGIVDDVLTTGAHYRAMKEKLRSRFPDVPIVGIFIARRIFPSDYIDTISR